MTVMFLDGNPSGCICGPECEMPCWQRVGMTDDPCCEGCAPSLPVDEGEPVAPAGSLNPGDRLIVRVTAVEHVPESNGVNLFLESGAVSFGVDDLVPVPDREDDQ